MFAVHPRLSNFYICAFIALRCVDGTYAKASSYVSDFVGGSFCSLNIRRSTWKFEDMITEDFGLEQTWNDKQLLNTYDFAFRRLGRPSALMSSLTCEEIH